MHVPRLIIMQDVDDPREGSGLDFEQPHYQPIIEGVEIHILGSKCHHDKESLQFMTYP